MTFGEDWGAAKDEARKIYDAYRTAGGNFIDTANIYTNGSSEKLVGEFIAGHREEVVVATKYTNAASVLSGKPGTDANAGGKPIRFQSIPADAYKAQLVQHGATEVFAQGLVDMMAAKDEGMDNAEPRTPENTTPTSFRQWCAEVLRPQCSGKRRLDGRSAV